MGPSKTATMTIGPAVRRFRVGMGMTQAQLADLADIATETLSRIETGRLSGVSMGLCGRLASALGVSTSDLFKVPPEPRPSQLRPSERALVALVSRLDDADVNDLVRSVRLMIKVASKLGRPPRTTAVRAGARRRRSAKG